MRDVTLVGRSLFILLLVIAGGMTGGKSALAQSAGREGAQDVMEKFRLQQLEASQKTYDKYYQKMLKRLRPYYEDPARGEPPFYNFIKSYRAGSRYDPFSDETVSALEELANAAGNSESSAEADAFKSLLEWHLPNYTILEGAMPLVRENPALADIELLEWMRSQITDRIQTRGGKSMELAVDISSIGEADFLLSGVASDVTDTEAYYGNGDHCYLIHTVESPLPDEPEKIYIMYSAIMRHVQDNYEVSTPYCIDPFVAPDAPKR